MASLHLSRASPSKLFIQDVCAAEENSNSLPSQRDIQPCCCHAEEVLVFMSYIKLRVIWVWWEHRTSKQNPCTQFVFLSHYLHFSLTALLYFPLPLFRLPGKSWLWYPRKTSESGERRGWRASNSAHLLHRRHFGFLTFKIDKADYILLCISPISKKYHYNNKRTKSQYFYCDTQPPSTFSSGVVHLSTWLWWINEPHSPTNPKKKCLLKTQLSASRGTCFRSTSTMGYS